MTPRSTIRTAPPLAAGQGGNDAGASRTNIDFRFRPAPDIGRRAIDPQGRRGVPADGEPLRGSWMSDGLLALGLLLSPASRLRPAGLPIGPGELCLLVWLVLMVGREIAVLGGASSPALFRLLGFWAVFAMALSIGTLTGYAIDDPHDPVWFMHDVIAYPLLAAVSCASVMEPGAAVRLHRVAWLLVVLGSGSLALQMIQALAGDAGSASWYWDRLRGWSQNPAQLAFLCAALALLTLHLAETAARPGVRAAAVASAVMPLVAGWLTRTDTFTLVILAAGGLFAVLTLRAWLLLPERKMTLRTAAAWIAILAVPLVLGAAALLAPSIAAQTSVLAKGLSKDKGKTTDQEADLRFELWGEAWNRGLQSGMLGLGPGPHLPIPPSIVIGRLTETGQPTDDPHPQSNNTPNFEAHDTVLDLFTQGGMLAVFSFLWLVATAIFTAYKARLMGLATLLGGLLVFSAFDLIIRYPIFWYSIAFCLVAGFAARRAAPAPGWR